MILTSGEGQGNTMVKLANRYRKRFLQMLKIQGTCEKGLR
jgi:hypothetical protein